MALLRNFIKKIRTTQNKINMEKEKLDASSIVNKFVALTIKEQNNNYENVVSVLKVFLESLLKEDGELFSANRNDVLSYMEHKINNP